jgi:hypothetical protein
LYVQQFGCCVLPQALRAAMELEPLLLGPIIAAAAGCQHAATRRTLGEVSTRNQVVPVGKPHFLCILASSVSLHHHS